MRTVNSKTDYVKTSKDIENLEKHYDSSEATMSINDVIKYHNVKSKLYKNRIALRALELHEAQARHDGIRIRNLEEKNFEPQYAEVQPIDKKYIR